MKDFFNKHNIQKTDKIIVACSGGSDSMYLLYLCINQHPKKNIIVCHFNHNLRGGESNKDEEFVKDFCIKNNLKYEIRHGNIKDDALEKKIGIEESARNLRYAFLYEIASKYKSEHILTAHHLDDSIETFLFNLLRGSSIYGLSGIKEDNDIIYRPLNKTTKQEILDQCKKNNIEYREDSSNYDDSYLRNHLRLNIIPEFSKINPNFRKSLSQTMEYFKGMEKDNEDRNEKMITDNAFTTYDFDILSDFRKKEFVAYIYKKSNKGTIGLTKGNIKEIIKFIGDKGNCTHKLVKMLHLFKKNGKIYIENGLSKEKK